MLNVDVECAVLGGWVAALGKPLREAGRVALVARSESSPFLASLDLAERVRLIGSGQPVGAIGTARLSKTTD